MAHHIFRRCLFSDIVPPPPPPPPSIEMDDRLILASEFALLVNGVEFGTAVCGLDTLASLLIVPIPPGGDTGGAEDRVIYAERLYPPSLSGPGLGLWGEFAESEI